MADVSSIFWISLKIETKTRYHIEDKGKLCEIVLSFDAYRFYSYFSDKKYLMILVYLLIKIFGTKLLSKAFIRLVQLRSYVPDASK